MSLLYVCIEGRGLTSASGDRTSVHSMTKNFASELPNRRARLEPKRSKLEYRRGENIDRWVWELTRGECKLEMFYRPLCEVLLFAVLL
jgi:hypothetical protein